MAWILHLLVGLTVMTSAYKCKHSPYSNSDQDSSRYDYANQEPLGIPDNRPHQRSNSPAVEIIPGYSSRVPDEIVPIRMEEPTRRSENGSKVLSWKPYPESRRGQMSGNDKIVFPGPMTNEEPFQLEIPEHCKKLGICENVPNYPKELVKKIIAALPDKSMFQNDELDLPDVPEITQRLGPQEENMELCNFQEKVMYPQAAEDSSGNWHVVLNQDDNPLQGFKVEICDRDESPCSPVAFFQQSYQARCVQKYVYRKMGVLHNGDRLEKPLRVPSCCSCVIKAVKR